MKRYFFIGFGLYGIFICPHLFFKSQIPVNGEIMRFVYPNWCLSRYFLTHFQWPLWNPFRDLGEPFLADPRSMSLYPPYGLALLAGRFMDFLRIWFLGHAILAAYFAFRLLRRLGGDPAAAVTAAALMAFGGFFVGHAWYPNQFAAAAYLPVVLFALLSGNCLGLTAALSLQWLAGYPPFFLLTFISAALLAIAIGRNAVRTLAWSSFAALGITAIQWLPFLEIIRSSLRPTILPASEAVLFSVSPAHMMKMALWPQWIWFKPQISGDPAMMSFYVGPFAIALAAWALWRGSSLIRILGIGTGMTFLLALGHYLPGYSSTPALHVFRFPASWLLVSSAGVAILAGKGVSLLPRKSWRWTACALVMLDLAIFHQAIQVAWFSPSFLDEPPAQIASLSQPTAGRVYIPDPVFKAWLNTPLANTADFVFFKENLIPSYATAFGVREVNSYQILQSKRWGAFMRKLNRGGPGSDARRWAGISRVEVLDKGATSVTSTSLHGIDFTDSVAPLSWASTMGSAGIQVVQNQPGKIDATVTSKMAGDRLVFSEMFYPGWKAFIDDQPVLVTPFLETFLSIAVPAGSHRVRFVYWPHSFMAGMIITLVSGLLFWRRRSS